MSDTEYNESINDKWSRCSTTGSQLDGRTPRDRRTPRSTPALAQALRRGKGSKGEYKRTQQVVPRLCK